MYGTDNSIVQILILILIVHIKIILNVFDFSSLIGTMHITRVGYEEEKCRM